jgi:hypothetical protein
MCRTMFRVYNSALRESSNQRTDRGCPSSRGIDYAHGPGAWCHNGTVTLVGPAEQQLGDLKGAGMADSLPLLDAKPAAGAVAALAAAYGRWAWLGERLIVCRNPITSRWPARVLPPR